MEPTLVCYLLGGTATLVMAFSKTGVPGAAILAVMLMALAFKDNERLSVGVMLPLLLLGDVLALWYYRRHAQWKRLWGLLPWVVMGMVPAVCVLHVTGNGELGPVLGWLVLLLLVLEVCRRRFAWSRVPQRWWFTAAMGSLAGFGTMVGNAAGPAMNLYLVARRMQKEQFVGTCAWFYFIVNLCKLPVFCWQGMITPATLQFDLKIAPLVLLGAAAGIVLLPRISQAVFSALVLLLTGVAAVWLIAA